MPDISVIVCAHNPRPDYLTRVLDALRYQTLSPERWELLIVDNASATPLALSWDILWHPNARHIREDELGVAVARRRGIKEAAAGILQFVDDDNVLQPDYLATALEIGRADPNLGVWGSASIAPEFETPPADALRTSVHYLALRDVAVPRSNKDFTTKEAMPWGAGMALRKNVAEAYRLLCSQPGIEIASRQGTSLMGGEDVEMCIVACELGYSMGIFPNLKLTHLIPKQRVTEAYLLRLREAHALTDVMLAYKWQRRLPRHPFSIRTLLGLLKNSVLAGSVIKRKMYLAYWRAGRAARRLIGAMANEAPAPSDLLRDAGFDKFRAGKGQPRRV